MMDLKATDFEQWVNLNKHGIPSIEMIRTENLAVMYMLDRLGGTLKDISDTLEGIENDLDILIDCVGDVEDDAEKFFVIAGGVDSYEH